MHSSMCTASTLKNTFKTLLYSLAPSYWLDEDYALQMKPIKEQIKDRWIGTGYLHAQATYPDTVGKFKLSINQNYDYKIIIFSSIS